MTVLTLDDLIRKFKREDYPQVAVSVGMLDTGFDCREVLHLVMCRRVRSPILYQQMRGRGTRTAPHIQKQKFVIYDFFGNHDYFNDSDTDIFSDMALINELHEPAIGIVPIGDRFTMGGAVAALACRRFFKFESVIPCHYGTFPIIDQTADKFVKGMQGTSTKVIVPKGGEAFEI